jgi:hypothetical protein
MEIITTNTNIFGNAQGENIGNDNSNFTDYLEKKNYIDPLDRTAKLEIAKKHGSAQKVYNMEKLEGDGMVSIIRNNLL